MNNEQTICSECGGTGLLWSEELQEEDCCKRCEGNGVIEQQPSEEKLFGNEKLTREELNENNKMD